MNHHPWIRAAAIGTLALCTLAACQRRDEPNGESTTTASTSGRDAANTGMGTVPPGTADAAASAASSASGPR